MFRRRGGVERGDTGIGEMERKKGDECSKRVGRGRNRGKLRTNAYRIEKRVKGGSQEKGEPEPRVQGTGSGRFGPCEKGSE